MRTIATVLIAALVFCSVAVAGPVLVINQDGSYQVMVDGPGGKSVLHDVTQVVDKRGGTPPPPDNPPAPTGLSAAVAAMSKQQVPNADEGTALTAAIQLVSKSVTTDQGIETVLDQTMTAVGLGLGAKTRIDAWYKALKALPGFTFTRAGLADTLKGLQTAYNVDAASIEGLVDTTLKGAKEGKTVEEINEQLAAKSPNAAFDFTMILTILTAIIELLKQLGILS